ncbi:MAG: hypothetical protein GX758_04580 [Tenericutes bacterium]|nr:hypothetical protein [Mycoplasmatota bacterium]
MNAFFKKLFKNKSIVTIIAGAICLAILFVAYNYRIKQLTNPVSVPYAIEDIPARTLIEKEMLGTVKIASVMLNTNVVVSDTNIIGKYVNYNTFIPAGSLFYSSILVNWESMPDAAWSNIYKENTIVSLNVNTKTTYGNSIYPSDKIDLYYKSVDEDGKIVLGKLIEGIEVLAVKDKSGKHILKRSSEQREASALIFSVPEDMHLLLRKSMYLDGELIPVPRNAAYNPTTTISSKYLKDFILSQTIEVQLDEIEETTVKE